VTDAARARPPRTLLWVALVAVAVRALYFAEHARSALSQVTVLDARYYELFARALASGGDLEPFATGFRPLLYPVLLAPLFVLLGGAGGGAVLVAQLAQHLLGVVTALLVALLARRLFRDEGAALAAGVLYALAPVPLFFEGQLLVETAFDCVVAALLLALARAGESTRPRPLFDAWFGAALLFVVAAQLRPNVLLLVAALPFAAGRGGLDRGAAAKFALTAALGLALAGLLSQPLLGRFQLLPSAGAVNLYLGNERGADGLVPRQDFAVTHGDAYRDTVELFAEEGFRRANAGTTAAGERPAAATLSRFWLGRTLDELRADPAGRLRLLGRKALVLFWNREVPNNLAFGFAAREETPLLARLPARFAVLLCLAAVGLLLVPARPPRFWTLAFALTHALGVVLFFVADRYRLPLTIPAAALAGGGLAGLAKIVRARDARLLARAVLFAGATALLALFDWTAATAALPDAGRDLYFRSIARLESGDPAGALADARRAARLAPDDAYVHLQVGVAALRAGETGPADAALRRAAELAPGEPRVQNALGVAAEARGDREAAERFYRRALELAPGFAPAVENLAALEAGLSATAPSRP